MRIRIFIQSAVTALAVLALASCSTTSNAPPLADVPLLGAQEKLTLQSWLSQHPEHRIATEADCNCGKDIQQMRASGSWGAPFPHYEPFVLKADFNKDGSPDFAVLIIRQKHADVTLAIFNGPFGTTPQKAAYVQQLNLSGVTGIGLFLTQEEHWPLIGPFESEGCIYKPNAGTYKEDCGND